MGPPATSVGIRPEPRPSQWGHAGGREPPRGGVHPTGWRAQPAAPAHSSVGGGPALTPRIPLPVTPPQMYQPYLAGGLAGRRGGARAAAPTRTAPQETPNQNRFDLSEGRERLVSRMLSRRDRQMVIKRWRRARRNPMCQSRLLGVSCPGRSELNWRPRDLARSRAPSRRCSATDNPARCRHRPSTSLRRTLPLVVSTCRRTAVAFLSSSRHASGKCCSCVRTPRHSSGHPVEGGGSCSRRGGSVTGACATQRRLGGRSCCMTSGWWWLSHRVREDAATAARCDRRKVASPAVSEPAAAINAAPQARLCARAGERAFAAASSEHG